MRNMGASADQAAGVRPREAEAWVYEKGLPRIGREPIVNHVGRRMLLAAHVARCHLAPNPADRQGSEQCRMLRLGATNGRSTEAMRATGPGSSWRILVA